MLLLLFIIIMCVGVLPCIMCMQYAVPVEVKGRKN